MKRFLILTAVIALMFQSVALGSEPILQTLVGTWQGSGEVRGMPSEQTMVWTPALGGQFFRLEFDNQMHAGEGQVYRFQAHAYYRPSPEGEIVGNWFDSRGVIFSLSGSQTACTLSIEWGSPDTETGRTRYHLAGNKLEVTDEVLGAEGEWRIFGQSVLERVELANE